MLDQLIKLVEQNAGEVIVKNQAIPNQHNNAAIQEVASQIMKGLKGQVAQGNMQQVVSLFQGAGAKNTLTSNPMVTQIVSNIAGNFASKFGVSPQVAKSVVEGLVPTVMNQLVSKTNNPKDSDFDLTDMMKGLSGNSNLDLSGMLGQLTGGNASQSPLGGLGGMLGGMFGKK